jgi:hypothetical protein
VLNLNGAWQYITPVMQKRANLPRNLAIIAAYHLAGAMPLESFSADGPTLYALTIYGLEGENRGVASITGAAINPAGLDADWPSPARRAALAVFAAPPQRRAGAVVVVVTMQIGSDLHYVVYKLPAAAALTPSRRGEAQTAGRGTGRTPVPPPRVGAASAAPERCRLPFKTCAAEAKWAP